MTDPRIDDDWLDGLLEADAGYIEDNGFTDGVLARLPSPTKRRLLPQLVLAMTVFVGGLFLLADGGASLNILAPILSPRAAWTSSALLSAVLVVLALGWVPLTMALEED